MPRPVGVIQKSGAFLDILSRFGVNRPQQPFTLDGDVVPVVLIDSAVSFVAAQTPPYSPTDIFTTGIQVAPAADTILATTGQLPVGAYTVQLIVYSSEAAGLFTFEWRNSADAANLYQQRFQITTGVQLIVINYRFNIVNANERFRCQNIVVGGAGEGYQATILARI